MLGSPQQVVGVAEQEEEDGDGEPVRDDAPLGQHPLQQAGAPHHHAGRQGQPLVVGDVVEVAPAHSLEVKCSPISTSRPIHTSANYSKQAHTYLPHLLVKLKKLLSQKKEKCEIYSRHAQHGKYTFSEYCEC